MSDPLATSEDLADSLVAVVRKLQGEKRALELQVKELKEQLDPKNTLFCKAAVDEWKEQQWIDAVRRRDEEIRALKLQSHELLSKGLRISEQLENVVEKIKEENAMLRTKVRELQMGKECDRVD